MRPPSPARVLALATALVAALTGAAFATPAAATASGEASVSFPIAVPAATQARISALARTAGGGAQRAAAVRAVTPPPSRAATVQAWARRNGFTVVHSSPWLVEVRGPAADLARVLGTGVSEAQVRGRRYAVRSGALKIPPALAGVVSAPVGLDERPHYRHRSFGGGDLQVMHDLPVRGSGAGADVTVGTLNLAGWHPGDLTEYVTAYGLRPPVVQSVVVGSGHVLATRSDDDDGGSGEVALDAQAIAGTAPSATQRQYFAGNSGADVVAALSKMADDAQAGLLQTASTSWGLCETNTSSTQRAAESAQIARLVAAGATFFAASGDSGAYGCSSPLTPDSTPTVDWPAADPSTVGMGGTTVTGDARAGYGTPTAWSLSGPVGDHAGSGSGGGCSTLVAKPAYQTAPTCSTGRAVPDMAALADPGTGYAIYSSADGGWVAAGGTSLASPVASAGLASYLSSQADKHGVGNILNVAYQHPEAFTDVTTGSNGTFQAGTGYDAVTGLGVPNWRLLGAALRAVAADPARPAFSNPLFQAPAAWYSLEVPFFADLNGGDLVGLSVRQDGNHVCAPGIPVDSGAGTFTLNPVADGPVAVTLTGTDPAMGCRATTRTLLLDRRLPDARPVVSSLGATAPRFALSWAFADPAPSSGSDGFTVKVTDATTGAVRLDLPWTTTRSTTFAGVAGHRYVLQVRSYDRAGNASPLRSAAFAQYDDSAATRSPGWTRVTATADFRGSHLVSATAGRSLSFRFTGKTLTAGMIKSRYGGYADVYVDGVRRTRVNLYATSSRYRQPVRLATFASAGTHTVVVKVVGAHASGSLGNYVFLDSLTVL